MSCSCRSHDDEQERHHHHCHNHEHAHDDDVEKSCASGTCACCADEADDDDDDDDDGDPKTKLMRIIAAAVLLLVAIVVSKVTTLPMGLELVLFLPAYLVAGYDVLLEAAESIRDGHAFDEDFLMAVATLGALAIGFVPGGSPEFAEAVFVMLFFQVGELFEGYAEGKSRRSIASLMDIRPDTANLETPDGVQVVDPAEVTVGQIVIVRPGERVPLDGEVIEGSSALDTVALTGEAVPREVGEGDSIFSGCVNTTGLLRVKTTKAFGESTASRILDLVEHASSNKSHSEAFIRRFARVYTPCVVYAALAVAIVPPLVSGDFAANFATWLLRGLTFLVVSCPCALVISVPLTFFGGIGAASRHGVLVKGSNYLEALSKVDTVVFDKTGTLTQGCFAVRAVHPEVADEHELLHLAAHVEQFSTHPIAAALRDAAPEAAGDACQVQDIQEVAGRGVIAQVNGHSVAVGNAQLMDQVGAGWHACELSGTQVHVAQDGTYLGHIVIADQVKPDAAEAIASLKAAGATKSVMLTGDNENTAAEVAAELGLDSWFANLLPADKVSHVEALLGQEEQGKMLAFVGDGINDAPVLARADVGIAMGGMGSDAAIEAADVVLMDDKPSKLADAMRVARVTARIARQNVVFAIAVKLAILVLAVFGLAPMWLAVFGDVGVMVLCVLNATRVLRA